MQIRLINQAANRVINAPYPPKGNNFKIIIYTKFVFLKKKGECYQSKSTFPGKNRKIPRDLLPVFPCVGKSSEGVDRFWQPLAKREFRTPQNTDHFPVSNVGRIRHLDDVEQQHLIMTFDLAVIPLFAFFFLWKKSPKQNKRTKMKRRRRKSVFFDGGVGVVSVCQVPAN